MPARRAAALAAVSCLISITVGTPAPAAVQEPDFELRYIGGPVWHDSDDRLGFRLRIANGSDGALEGFSLAVGASYKVRSRSQLHSNFDPNSFDGVTNLPSPLEFDDEVEPDDSLAVTVRDRVSALGIDLLDEGESGVYPVKITLYDGAGLALDSIAVPLIYYDDTPGTQLAVAPVVTLNEVPARGPDGLFEAGPDRNVLEEAFAADGWLRVVTDTLGTEVARGLRLGLAPTPRFLEETVDMADGYRRRIGAEVIDVSDSEPGPAAARAFLAAFESLAAAPGVQPLLVPYSAPDLPSIAPQPNAIQRHLDAGETVVERLVPEINRGWVYAPAGHLDEGSFDQLSLAGAQHVVFGADSLVSPDDPDQSGCPVLQYSFTCPVEVATALGRPLTGLVSDDEIQERLAELTRPDNDRLDAQRLFAETSMIREESPANGARVIALTIPETWHPSPLLAEIVFGGLARAPWMRTVTPGESLEVVAPRARSLEPLPEPPAGQTSIDFFENATSAEEEVRQYASLGPPEDITQRLSRNLLVSHSRSLWGDPRAADYITQTRAEVNRELAKIRIIGPDEITLTSQRGQVQFVIINSTGYPITVDVELGPERLELEEVGPQTISGEQERLTFDVMTDASGIFPVTAQLLTPDGAEITQATPITVRSTQFNEIALGITFGALAFLILFYVVRGARRRRARRARESTA
jgi:hypothetical protein